MLTILNVLDLYCIYKKGKKGVYLILYEKIQSKMYVHMYYMLIRTKTKINKYMLVLIKIL